MIILGHPFFESETLYKISSFEEVKKTPSNSTVLIDFSPDEINTIKELQKNGVNFALHVNSLKEVIFAANFKAKYVLVPDTLAKIAQDAANEYLFDTKILVLIQNETEIENLAKIGIDGVAFSEAIKEAK